MSSSHIIIRVLDASTGVSYPMSLPPNDITVRNIRQNLISIVPLQDQILLLGPPYKVPKDATLRSEETLSALRLGDSEDDPNHYSSCTINSKDGTTQPPPNTTKRRKRILSTTEKSGARRLFLFSKRTFSESSPDPLPCTLDPLPTPILLPTEPEPSPISFTSSTTPPSPLHQALQVYERQFMLQLNRAALLSSTATDRLASLQICLSEQVVMSLALRAAVSNLSDHRNAAARTRTDLHTEFQSRLRLETMGGSLDGVFEKLARVPLHPKLVDLARGSARIMKTLLDTVMVERERNWWNKCKEGRVRLEQLFNEVDHTFGQLHLSSNDSGGVCNKEDVEVEERIEGLLSEMEGKVANLINVQRERMVRLERDHKKAVDVVLGALGKKEETLRQEASDNQQQQQEGEEGENTTSQPPTNEEEVVTTSQAQQAFMTLEEMSNATKNIIPSMEADDLTLCEIAKRVASQKTEAMNRMKLRLRQVSHAQSAIQKVLSNVSILKDALVRWEADASHLEHTRNLPSAYTDFLSECRRRRAYGEAVRARAGEMVEVLGAMRTEEVRMREKFLRGSGRHLMPAFFEVFVPTLATPPPLFAPQLPVMVEMDTLPDFGVAQRIDEVAETGDGIEEERDAERDSGDVISSFPLEDDKPLITNASATNTEDVTTSQIATSSLEDESLIVRADPDDNIILGGTATTTTTGGSSANNTAESETRQTMLAYENSVLRQALERMGGHAPHIYVDKARREAKKKKDESIVALQKQLADMSSQLNESKALLKHTNDELRNIKAKREEERKSPGNKISYFNFKVGDVALFMPTSSKEKRGYVAFHINSPHKYLNTDSIEGNPDYVLGRIVIQEELVAGAKGTAANPHGLVVGTKFWILTVEVLKIQVPKGCSTQSPKGSAVA